MSVNRLRALMTALLAVLFILPMSAKTYIVSAGIADYPGTANDLTNCVRDAEAVAWIYDHNDTSNTESILLRDSEATQANIIAAMTRLFARAGADDTILFFYSGHGYRGGFVTYDGNLSYARMREAMASSRARNKMIFADACYSGRFRDENPQQSQSDEAAARRANVVLFLSSRSDETSIERSDMQNGFFTTYLVRGLRGRADKNRDRTITAREIFEYVASGVKEISHDRQHPVMWGNFSNNMPVIMWPRRTR